MPPRDESLGYLVNWAARLFTRQMEGALRPHGMAPGQLPVLFALAQGEPMSQGALAASAAVEQPTMANTLARMERDGLIVRSPHPSDKRSALISLTEQAHARIPSLVAAIDAINHQAQAALSKAEAAQLLALLTRVIASLDGALPTLDPTGGPDDEARPCT